jgi:hypothetical protein
VQGFAQQVGNRRWVRRALDLDDRDGKKSNGKKSD